ncbi:hypothetical protein BN10_1600006 [Phycicoccus elongatus Lp2]|uniref:Uncharacterized protein n=1 Tax=Phycicoccus elongatus Lp2 TaxID=1193181 RepID=N0DYH9_9MICO|nr:hypothetical protein BN10_1600006 [Phycicoccus elongatus Lp2]
MIHAPGGAHGLPHQHEQIGSALTIQRLLAIQDGKPLRQRFLGRPSPAQECLHSRLPPLTPGLSALVEEGLLPGFHVLVHIRFHFSRSQD